MSRYALGLSLTWALACAAAPEAPLTSDELIVLNSVSGWGDTGTVVAEREQLAPGNGLGFSLRFRFTPNPGGAGFWAIRIPLPLAPGESVERYDTLSLDYRIVAADEGAALGLFLTESDDDRWLCRGGALTAADREGWVHLEVPRERMSMWFCGNQKAEWPRVGGLGVEPSAGAMEFLLDNLELRGPDGARLPILTTADEVLPYPTDPRPVAIPPRGTVFLPGLARQNLLDARTPERFGEALGALGSAANTAEEAEALAEQGASCFFYSTLAEGQTRFLTRRGGWDVNAAGESPNTTPLSVRGFTFSHTIASAHPAVTEAGVRRAESLARSGIGVWTLVDYTFPWREGPFGYAPAQIEAYRADLGDSDEGLLVREGDAVRRMGFPEYVRGYWGFMPEPAELGLASWAEFAPPRPGQPSSSDRASWPLTLLLRSWEWLKLPDRTGRALQRLGGEGTWIIPNPEDSYGSSDYVHLLRAAGIRNLFPEWFGNPVSFVEAGFASHGYLREEADRSGSRMSVLFETGAGGHAAPYWDWRIAYASSYLLTALCRGDDLDNDFLDEGTWEHQSDPANASQFARFRDGMAKAIAFQQARREGPSRPATEILCISERPPARSSGSIFYSLGQRHSLAPALSRAHLAFDLRDCLDLERVLDRYRMVAYSPWNPRVGDWELLRAWLGAERGRVLVTHSFLPSRDARGFWGLEAATDLGDGDGARILGLGEIALTDALEVTVTAAQGEWAAAFPPGTTLRLPTALSRCTGGEVLVDTDRGPLLSSFALGGGTVLYLHTSPGEHPEIDLLGPLARAMTCAAGAIGAEPLCEADLETPVQLLDVPGGRVVAMWDAPTLGKWEFRYEPGIPPLLYPAEGVRRSVRIPMSDGAYRLFDALEGRESTVRAEGGFVTLQLADRVAGLTYLCAEGAEGDALLASARSAWERVRGLRLDQAP